jgi:taurine dioxygenase
MTTTALSVRQSTSVIGAEVRGLDLSAVLSDVTVKAVRELLLAHKVLFFPNQTMSEEDQVRFAHSFGDIDIPLFRTTSSGSPQVLVLDQLAPRGEGADSWHADNTYMPAPPMASILMALKLPEVGGDTCFASMPAAYDALSPALQGFLDSLHAEHSLAIMAERTRHVGNASLRDEVSKWPPVVHPVVRVHPETGEKLLNVNANWTSHVVELSPPESDALLQFLYRHLQSPDFQVRFRWAEGSVAMWDNRAVQHYAVPDYHERRVMRRVTIAGDRPFGPGETSPAKGA